jgi:hypothetical protein
MAQNSVWYRIGYALERVRGSRSSPRLRSMAERLASDRKDDTEGDARDALDTVVAAGSAALLSRILQLREPDHRTGVTDLLRAGAAGAGASLLHELVAPLLHGEIRAPDLDGHLGEALLAGAARGLVYASLVEPRLPGPALARGLVFGTAEYLASPWGGLTKLAGRSAPHRKIPFFSGLFEEADAREDHILDHLAFAVALAALYRQGD